MRSTSTEFQPGVFDSATGDQFDSVDSDIDFVVEFEPMTLVEPAKAYFGLAEDLAQAFGRKIDLVELSAVRNPIFRRPVEKICREVYVVA